MTNWIKEIIIKNQIIKVNPKKEEVNRVRQNVYWIDFGFNIGTEFNFPHFCVVIKEFNKTAIVVPISSDKNDDSEYKTAKNLYIPIGKIDGFPEEKRDCYAVISQIRTVSKQRLSDYKYKGKFIKLHLNADQMKLVFEGIKSLSEQKIKEI